MPYASIRPSPLRAPETLPHMTAPALPSRRVFLGSRAETRADDDEGPRVQSVCGYSIPCHPAAPRPDLSGGWIAV